MCWSIAPTPLSDSMNLSVFMLSPWPLLAVPLLPPFPGKPHNTWQSDWDLGHLFLLMNLARGYRRVVGILVAADTQQFYHWLQVYSPALYVAFSYFFNILHIVNQKVLFSWVQQESWQRTSFVYSFKHVSVSTSLCAFLRASDSVTVSSAPSLSGPSHPIQMHRTKVQQNKWQEICPGTPWRDDMLWPVFPFSMVVKKKIKTQPNMFLTSILSQEWWSAITWL